MSNISNKQYNFELSYTPYDFYYSTNRKDLPSNDKCSVLEEENKINAFKCDDDSNIEKCYQYELCKNENLVNTCMTVVIITLLQTKVIMICRQNIISQY